MSDPRVTLRMDRDSYSLYAEAIRLNPILAATFILEPRPPTLEQRAADEWKARTREWAALARGRRTLSEIRAYMREHHDDPMRAYWRDAKRRERSMGK